MKLFNEELRRLKQLIANGHIDVVLGALLSLMERVATNYGHVDTLEHDERIVENASELWVSLIIYQADELLPQVYKTFTDTNWIGALLTCSSASIRKDFANALYQICEHTDITSTVHSNCFPIVFSF